ncbi:MAG: ABC transporter permease [Bryobacterales bacterium]|nr:ABC transporter permease [Bryobacterales bacterium]MBV9399597.1 ABC transporter permease [Bryobacterales bacterium]
MIRYSVRVLRRNPMFTGVVLLTLAISIGANATVFSVVNSVLWNPLAYPKPEELVALRQAAPGAAGLANVSDGLLLSPSMYFTYAEQNRSFQSMGVWVPVTANITGLAEPEQVRAIAVSDGVLQALRVPPLAGRALSSADQVPGGRPTVMLSYGYWQQRFGGESSAIGRDITVDVVDAQPRRIIGIMPKGFRVLDTDFDLLVPIALDRSRAVLPGFGFQGIARLKPGVTIEQANADLARLIPVWMNSWPTPGANPRIYETWKITPALRPLKDEIVGDVRSFLWVVMGTILIVMLIACANVANLVLVHIESRQRELSIRAALGAGKRRIVAGLLIESLILSLAGGLLGIVLADQALRLLVAIGPSNLPRLSEIALDARAIFFTLGVSIFSGLLFGIVPALKYAGPRIVAALRSAGRTVSANRERRRASNLLVITQVAMALVLLVSAGLMIRTFQALRTVEPGFTDARQTMRITVPATITNPDAITRMQNEIVNKLDSIPGVRSAAFASSVPMEGVEFNWDGIRAEGQPETPGQIPPLRMFKYVSPGFFQTIGANLVAGRDLSWIDMYGHRPVALVSENLARELWGSPSTAVGKRFRYIADSPWREVIGVVQDIRENGVQAPAPAVVYWPTMTIDQFGPGPLTAMRAVTFAVRSDRTGTEGFLNEIRRAVWSVDSNLPIAASRSMEEIYSRFLGRTSFTLVMLGIAGAMALVLGIIGIYGVIAYAVSQRRREIGIRLALGAQPVQVRRMFLRHGITLAGIGLAAGIASALPLARLMSSVLFGVKPADPTTFVAMALVLALAAALASYIPARRASAVDPVETLASE